MHNFWTMIIRVNVGHFLLHYAVISNHLIWILMLNYCLQIKRLSINFSPPELSFSPRQYIDEYGRIQEDPPFDGDPSHKRRYLERNRPIDWLPE